jgi:hypothetical protein
MRINIYAQLITIEILDEIYARAKNWSTVEYVDLLVERLVYVLLQLYEIIPEQPAPVAIGGRVA